MQEIVSELLTKEYIIPVLSIILSSQLIIVIVNYYIEKHKIVSDMDKKC